MPTLLEGFIGAIPVAFMALITVINPLGSGFAELDPVPTFFP